MSTPQFLFTAWTWNIPLLLCSAAALAAYLAAYHLKGHLGIFLTGLGLFLITLLSPLNTLADGYLFSAHMTQHILLLLAVPALFLASLPEETVLPKFLRKLAHPLVGWIAGVGAMWFWHAPALCNAAASSHSVFAGQTLSLLLLGTAFWWQIMAPREEQRLSPPAAVVYLFTACAACTALGIIITFAPVTVCSVYMHPVDKLGALNLIRQGWGITPERDQQIGGLMMWVPMCLIYLAAIFVQVGRWYGTPSSVLAATRAGRES